MLVAVVPLVEREEVAPEPRAAYDDTTTTHRELMRSIFER